MMSESKVTVGQRCITEGIKDSPPKNFRMKKREEGYLKTRSEGVNERMGRILKNWKKNKNSVNERYF